MKKRVLQPGRDSSTAEYELSTVIDTTPKQTRLATRRHKQFLRMLRGAGLAMHGLHVVRDARAEFIVPASDRSSLRDFPRGVANDHDHDQ